MHEWKLATYRVTLPRVFGNLCNLICRDLPEFPPLIIQAHLEKLGLDSASPLKRWHVLVIKDH